MVNLNNSKSKTPTRTETIVARLAAEILRDKWEKDDVLPAERELSEKLDVSRPTLREALRQLERMGLVLSRQGSGTRVLDWRESATIDVFPIYLQQSLGTNVFAPIVRSSLRVRVAPLLEAIRWLARPDAKVNFLRLRQELLGVWAFRDDPIAFIVQDFEWIKTMTLASGYYPALWVMNAFVANYIRLIKDVGLAAPPPSDYCETWGEILNQCKAHEGESACIIATQYFDRHDDALLEFIAPMTVQVRG